MDVARGDKTCSVRVAVFSPKPTGRAVFWTQGHEREKIR